MLVKWRQLCYQLIDDYNVKVLKPLWYICMYFMISIYHSFTMSVQILQCENQFGVNVKLLWCFGSIVYSRAIVYKRQNFLKVVVHVIIIDQSIQATVIGSRIILVAVTSECCVKRVICKTWTGLGVGILANSADPDQTPQNVASGMQLV